MPSRDDLADFQDALLDLLAQEILPEELQSRLASDDRFTPFGDYVQAMEPRMLEVAAQLVKKWGKRAE